MSDLEKFPWLHDSLRASKWPLWLAACGVGELASERSMKLQDTEATLTAAVAGLGVAMGHAVLIDHDVREDRLAVAWPHQAPLAAGYHLLQSKRAQRNAAASALAEWLRKEASEFQDATE